MAKATTLPLLDPTAIIEGERFREDYGNLEGLRDSILESGLAQPITINRSNQLVAGGRRLRAFKLAIEKEPANKHVKEGIPVIVRHDTGETSLREIELVENLHRKDMTWIEEVKLVRRIHDLHKIKDPRATHGDTGEKLGMSKSLVALKLELHDALEAFPELAKSPNQETARRTFKALLEEAVVQEGLAGARHTLANTTVDEAGNSSQPLVERDQASIDWNSVFIRAADTAYTIGDTLSLLPKVRPGSFNFAEVDPPYAIDLTEQKPGSEALSKYNEISRENYPDFLKRLAAAVFRALAPDSWAVWWFGPEWYTEVCHSLTTAGFAFDPIPAVWTKPESGGQSNAPDVNLARGYEPFMVVRKGSPVLRKRGRLNNFSFKPVAPATKIHPTERPLELMTEIYNTFTFPKMRVVIPFLGSGVSIIAAIETGSVFTCGWDLEESYKNHFLARVATRWPVQKNSEELDEAV